MPDNYTIDGRFLNHESLETRETTLFKGPGVTPELQHTKFTRCAPVVLSDHTDVNEFRAAETGAACLLIFNFHRLAL